MNILEQGDNDLVPVDYSDLLQKILQILRNHNPFQLSANNQRLLIDIDALAAQVATLSVQNPLASSQGVRSASVHFSAGFRESFPSKIREIRDALKQQLEATLSQRISLEQLVPSLTTPLESFQGKSEALNLTYAFNQTFPNLQKQELSLERNRPGSDSLLKFHKLTITVRQIDRFQQELQRGLENYIEQVAESESDRQEINRLLEERIAEPTSDFYRLQRVVDTETLGKLKKEAKIRYLEYLRDNINPTDSRLVYLQDLIRRLRLIEEYINDDNKTDDEYEAHYAGARVNYKDLFSRAEVLDSLPIIPIVTGNLGESTDTNRGERQFIFGLKLKFGNPVQAYGGEEVFDYNLNLLNPDKQEDQGEGESKSNFGAKVLKLAFLYFFVFACPNPNVAGYQPSDDLNYNPIPAFEQILLILQGDDEEAKNTKLKQIVKGFNTYQVRGKIDKLKALLQDLLKKVPILPTRTYPIQISVKKGILERDSHQIYNGVFFNEVLGRNPKECLRYISISKEAQVDQKALCQLPASITLEDIRYFSTNSKQQFRMEYDIGASSALPVLWVPDSEGCMREYQQRFKQHKLVLFRYHNRRLDPQALDSTQAFIYQFTVSLLAYISLKILLEQAQKSLFIPMLRLHEGDHNRPRPSEKFMANLSKVLSQLFSDKHRVSSQGFRIHTLGEHTISNGLSSLYSLLPKKFRFTNASDTPTLDKLAIIVVSSLESDARTGNRNRGNRLSNLFGEVISITRQQDGAIRVEILKTFSDNYRHQRLYRDPSILLDTVNNLYQAGYRHFLYIAQAPYTSTLHITQSDENEGLFFMSPKLIGEMKGDKNDIKIYPVFFDKYYVRKRSTLKEASFYIQDINQLANVALDTSQKAVVFFNLFNGFSIGNKSDRFYNGVISYSTLLSIYPDILDDAHIRQGLINNESPLKNDLLNYLALFHFSRFEKSRNINLKLDPYENILGEESFAKLSVFHHMRGEIDFNSLAFLTEVQNVLNIN